MMPRNWLASAITSATASVIANLVAQRSPGVAINRRTQEIQPTTTSVLHRLRTVTREAVAL